MFCFFSYFIYRPAEMELSTQHLSVCSGFIYLYDFLLLSSFGGEIFLSLKVLWKILLTCSVQFKRDEKAVFSFLKLKEKNRREKTRAPKNTK